MGLRIEKLIFLLNNVRSASPAERRGAFPFAILFIQIMTLQKLFRFQVTAILAIS